MWNDLTMSERADVIKMAVKAGLRDMKSIRDFYDNSLKYADGGSKPGMTGMMKSKLAIASHFGNPTARRMTNYDTRNYTFPNRYDEKTGLQEIGNVYVSSYDNLVTPQIQDNGKELEFVPEEKIWDRKHDPRSYAQSIKFYGPNANEDARYFGEHYKEVAPMMNLYADGGPKVTYGKPYYSYDKNMQVETDNGKPILNYSATLPEINIIPDSKKSPADRNADERFRQKTFSDYAEHKDREYTQRQIMKSQRDWDNSLEKKALGYAQDAMTGVGIGADIVSGYPIYSSLKGTRVLSEADSLPEYIEGGLWLAPVGGVVGKEAIGTGKSLYKKALRVKPFETVQESVNNVNWDPDYWFKDISGRTSYSQEKSSELASHVPEYTEIEKDLFSKEVPLEDASGNIVVKSSNVSLQEYMKMHPELNNQIRKELQDANTYKISEGYKELIRKSRKESSELGIGDFSEELFLNAGRKEAPLVRIESRPKGSIAAYKYKENVISIDPTKLEGKSIEGVPYHEGLHYKRIGNPAIPVNEVPKHHAYIRSEMNGAPKDVKEKLWKEYFNSEEFPKVKGLYNAQDYIKYKIEKALKEDASSYMKTPGELVTQGLEAGKVIGIEPFSPYPGYDKALKAALEARRHNTWLNEVKLSTPEDVKTFWQIITGQYHPVIIPLIGGAALSNQYGDGGSIHISPSKRGTFTAAATKHGMGVQEFASKVLANKDDYSPAMVKKANFAKNASKWNHGLGGYLFEEGGPKVTLVDSDKVRMNNSGVFSDDNGNIIGDSVMLPEVTIKPTTPQTNNSSYYQQWLMREADRGGRNMSSSDREAYDRMMHRVANQNEVKNFTGFDGTIYNHGSGALQQVSPEFDALLIGRQLYTDGILGLVNKTTKNYKPNFAKTNTPKDEELVASISTDYSAPHGNYETYFNNYNSRVFDRGTLENAIKTGKDVTSKPNNPSIPSKLNIDSDKRFMLFEPGKYINYDIGNMSIKEVESTFGPDAVRYKKLYDIAKAHNFEGKYAQIGEDAQYNILNRFAISRNDPDISKAIAEAKGIYDIPEYADRFKKWGTLGDTFITDAKARIDNATIQGLSRDLKIKGQHGVTGGAYTKPDATGIGIKNTDNSSYLIEMTRHEMNHVGHGLRNQPKWMEIHNEKFRPIVKKGRTTETSLDKYYDEMDELVERGKTAIEYANKTRKKGETLDAALERVHNEAAGDIYNPKVPSDIRQMVARYTKESTLNFWKNFVGGSIPFGLGYTIYKGSNKKE